MPAEPTFDWVDIDLLIPNPWNPNAMDTEMFSKAIESIHRFGFVDPVTVREVGLDGYQIIDGEHRVRAAKEHSGACTKTTHVGMTQLPITNLGMIDDHAAKQLTIVLNETRGEPEAKKLGVVLTSLLAAEPLPELLQLLPFSQARFEELAELPKVDWDDLEPKVVGPAKERWVERVYRIKADEVSKLDDAIKQAKVDGAESDGDALLAIAENYTG
jgi:ParB-like nuclease domain